MRDGLTKWIKEQKVQQDAAKKSDKGPKSESSPLMAGDFIFTPPSHLYPLYRCNLSLASRDGGQIHVRFGCMWIGSQIW